MHLGERFVLMQCTSLYPCDNDKLNLRVMQTYRERFGFPFVICVRDKTKESILDAYDERLAHDPEIELAIALDEIVKIMRLRIADLLAA